MLADDPFQQSLWTTGNDLFNMCILSASVFLARVCQYMVAYVHRTLLPRIWHRPQVSHRSHIRCRNFSPGHSRCTCYAMADVDRIWDFLRLCGRLGLLQGARRQGSCRVELALDDGLRYVAGTCCNTFRFHGKSFPKITGLVHSDRTAYLKDSDFTHAAVRTLINGVKSVQTREILTV